MKLSMNIFNDTPIRQKGLKTLREEVKRRFPQHIPEEILLLLMDSSPLNLIFQLEDLIGYVRFKDKIFIEVDKEQPLILHIEEHEDLLRLPSPLQDILRQRFSLLLGG